MSALPVSGLLRPPHPPQRWVGGGKPAHFVLIYSLISPILHRQSMGCCTRCGNGWPDWWVVWF